MTSCNVTKQHCLTTPLVGQTGLLLKMLHCFATAELLTNVKLVVALLLSSHSLADTVLPTADHLDTD